MLGQEPCDRWPAVEGGERSWVTWGCLKGVAGKEKEFGQNCNLVWKIKQGNSPGEDEL